MKKSRVAEYEFRIDVYSPETMPMKRLGEYMLKLGRMLGSEDRVHFRRLKKGSTALRYEVEFEAVPKIEGQLAEIRSAEAANDVMFARREIDEMLRGDNAKANIRRVRGGRVREIRLEFAGRDIPKPQRVGPFSAFATIKGELTRLEGKDETIHAGIKDSSGRNWSGYMDRELAKRVRTSLFEMVRVSGDARWLRNEAGEWELIRFHIRSCDALSEASLEDDVRVLRDVPGGQWREIEDPNEFISKQRHDDDEVH